jgi:phosphate transport system permease protein
MSTQPVRTQQITRQPKPSKFSTLRRQTTNHVITALSILATVLVIAPLVAILVYLIYKGASSLNFAFFTHIPAPVGEQGGGMANSIVGSGVILFLASLMGIPIGIAAGVYLAEFGRGKLLANAIRFTADVLNGVPSIVMGISIYSLIVLRQKHFSALAGGVALAIMMVPTITRTTEEMLATVPHAIREAALGLGVPKWRTVLSVSLRTAWHYHRLHAGLRPRRWRDRSVAFHRLRQPVLELQTQRANRRAAAPDLHLRHLALRRMAPSCLGRIARPHRFDYGCSHARPDLR